ncbi:MAG: glutamate 5-kinase, partial [Actinomycetota bacterium]|nr:glutamate 5-kinase [Actinomycetota bacterium]
KGKEVGTRFLASKAIKSKKHWIGFAKQSSGRLVIDEGAAKALIEKGKSLLSAGVVEIEGEFSAGDCVDIFCKDGRYIGRGLVNYGYREAERVKGLRSDQIEEVLGDSSEVLVHRDQLLVLETPGGTNE